MLQETNAAPDNTSSPGYIDYIGDKIRSGIVTVGGYAGGSLAVRYGVPVMASVAIGYSGLPVAVGTLIVVDRFAPSALTPVYWVGSKVAEGVTSLAIDGMGGAITYLFQTKKAETPANNTGGPIVRYDDEWQDVLESAPEPPVHDGGAARHPLDNSLRI